MSFQINIPHFYCYLRAEYTYDLQDHYGQFFDVCLFAVDSIPGRALGFDCVTNFGAMFARLPISAFVHRQDAHDFPLDYLQLWSSFSYDIEIITYDIFRHAKCDVLLKDRIWYPGEYMMTFSWMKSQYAEDPGEGGFKRAHLIKLDTGNFCLQPNNRIRWYDASFITKDFPERPDFLTNSRIWLCEQKTRWSTEDSERYFYDNT